MLFFLSQHMLEHDARRRIVVAEVTDQFLIMFNHDPLGNEVLLDHLDEVAYPSGGASNYPQVVAAAIRFGAFGLEEISGL